MDFQEYQDKFKEANITPLGASVFMFIIALTVAMVSSLIIWAIWNFILVPNFGLPNVNYGIFLLGHVCINVITWVSGKIASFLGALLFYSMTR